MTRFAVLAWRVAERCSPEIRKILHRKSGPSGPPQVASSQIRRTSRTRKKEVPFIWWYLNRIWIDLIGIVVLDCVVLYMLYSYSIVYYYTVLCGFYFVLGTVCVLNSNQQVCFGSIEYRTPGFFSKHLLYYSVVWSWAFSSRLAWGVAFRIHRSQYLITFNRCLLCLCVKTCEPMKLWKC